MPKESWLNDLFGGVAGGLAIGALETVVRKFTEKTAEKTVEKFTEYAVYKIFGLKSEDERRFNAAGKLMAQNWYSRLMERLAALPPSQSDFYRLTVMNDDVNEIFKILQFHAQMDDITWGNHLQVMNINLAEAEGQWQRFTAWARNNVAWIGAALGNISQGITDDLHGSGIIDGCTEIGDRLHRDNTRLLDNLFGR